MKQSNKGYLSKYSFPTPEVEALFRTQGCLKSLQDILKLYHKQISSVTAVELLKLEIKNLKAILKIQEKSLTKQGLWKPKK